MSYRNIIVPLDGTPFAETLLPHAIDLCQKFQAECHLIQAIPENWYAPQGVVYPGAVPLGMIATEDPTERRQRDIQRASDYLAEIQERLDSQGLKTTKPVVLGVAEDEILKHQNTVQADLILVTSHQRTGLSRLLAPNTATVISIQAECPVMTIRGTEDQSAFGELSLSRRIQEALTPSTADLADALSCAEETIRRALPRAVGMLLAAVAENRHRGPKLAELFRLTEHYPSAQGDLTTYLKQFPDEPPLKLVSQMFHERGAWAASALAQDVEGLETDQSLGLLAILTPIVLVQLKNLAEPTSELRTMIREQLSQTTPDVQESAQKTSRIVASA